MIDERHNVVKENPNEIVNTDKYTTIPTTEYTTTSDTISTETEPVCYNHFNKSKIFLIILSINEIFIKHLILLVTF